MASLELPPKTCEPEPTLELLLLLRPHTLRFWLVAGAASRTSLKGMGTSKAAAPSLTTCRERERERERAILAQAASAQAPSPVRERSA